VALSQGDDRWAEKALLEADDGAGGVAEHAVDAHAVLLEFVQFGWSLQQLSLRFRDHVLVADQPRLDLRQLSDESTDLDDEVADHREVAQRLNADRAGAVIGKEGAAGQPWLTIDCHSAAPADAHAAGPAVRQRPVDLILNVVQAIQDSPFRAQRDLV